VEFEIEASILFLYYLVLLGLVQLLFFGALHQIWFIVSIRQKVLQCFGVLFWSSAKLLILESDH
jgi:hypothetical protein